MSEKRRILLVIFLLMMGIGVMAYPVLSNYVNLLNGSYAIQELTHQLDDLGSEELERQRQLAEAYNAGLTGTMGTEALRDISTSVREEYYDIMEFGNGIMGCVQIPDIGVELAIYHGVSENVLQKGVGHIPQSAFPIGGVGNHTVLTGHTGLPSAELFTDLAQLVEGNLFYLSVLGEVLAYQVDQIEVVLPEETELLSVEEGRDYCTLVTCTPYGINSHRLLVRGERVAMDQDAIQQHVEAAADKGMTMSFGLLAAILAEFGLIVAAVWVVARKEEKATETQTDERGMP